MDGAVWAWPGEGDRRADPPGETHDLEAVEQVGFR